MKCLLCKTTLHKTLTDKIRGGEKKKVYYCSTCDLGILDVKHNDKWLKNYYENDYRHNTTPEKLFELYVNSQQDRVKLIKSYLKEDTILLEIGCSAGMFLYNIKDYVKEIWGDDYDFKSIQFATKKVGVKRWTYFLNKDIKFDIICAFQTLEHVHNPIKFIKHYSQFLKPNGILYLEVPNLYDALRYVYKLPNHYEFWFHKNHLWYFSEESLKKTLSTASFYGNIFYTQDYNLFNHLHWIITDTPQNKELDDIELPFRDISLKTKEDLTNLFSMFDSVYQARLRHLKITSNISFIGGKFHNKRS